jgi:hypothetical protein
VTSPNPHSPSHQPPSPHPYFLLFSIVSLAYSYSLSGQFGIFFLNGHSMGMGRMIRPRFDPLRLPLLKKIPYFLKPKYLPFSHSIDAADPEKIFPAHFAGQWPISTCPPITLLYNHSFYSDEICLFC